MKITANYTLVHKVLTYLKRIRVDSWLFFLALLIYLLTRLIGLPNFPIYFFTDEAIQSIAASDLVNNGFRNDAGSLLPTYFENGSQFNLSLSVYLQVIPNLIFGRSIWVTRGTAVMATLLAAIFLGLILRDFCKVKHWWLGPLVLAVIPAWFLHSRTAFETTLMVSMYAGFLYFYLGYRYKNPKKLFPTILLGALAFYSYSPGQVVVVVTGLLLLFTDLSYHWRNRKTILVGMGLLIIVSAPYIRFRITQTNEVSHHLQMLKSYWLDDIPVWQKILAYLARYFKGLNPLYWYVPNNTDLIRHQMKGMGHISLVTLPFLLIGLWRCVRNFRSPNRIAIIALLAAPTGAALVDIAITRVLVMIIPIVLITSIGINSSINWLKKLKMPKVLPSLITFVILSLSSFWILREALIKGPRWYSDYTLYGLQYGGEQLFAKIESFQKKYPEKRIILSPSWANGSEVIARYFLGDPLPIEIGSINAFTYDVLPLDQKICFVMLPNEYDWMLQTGKFSDIQVLDTLSYPDGNSGFYFVTLNYVEGIEDIISHEKAERRIPLEDFVIIRGQSVPVQYPMLDINEIQQAFDGDETTLIRTFEANPLKIVLTFSPPIKLDSVTALVGGASTEFTVRLRLVGNDTEITFATQVEEAMVVRPISLDFGATKWVDAITIEVLNSNDGENAHVHLWEIILN
ncbi:MAG: hypothetical protein MUO40_14415 [Anaerolineaceae bacterium]|nr:hypothetical protein [Anaerolineaceae bacterium]